jgi:hypothetical protein
MLGSIAAALSGFAFIVIGIGALFAPAISSAQYGLPTTDRTALALVRAIGGRDLVLGVIVVLLLGARNRAALELVLGVSILAAVVDVAAVSSVRDEARGARLGVHIGGAAALAAAWRLVHNERGAE